MGRFLEFGLLLFGFYHRLKYDVCWIWIEKARKQRTRINATTRTRLSPVKSVDNNKVHRLNIFLIFLSIYRYPFPIVCPLLTTSPESGQCGSYDGLRALAQTGKLFAGRPKHYSKVKFISKYPLKIFWKMIINNLVLKNYIFLLSFKIFLPLIEPSSFSTIDNRW